MRETRRALAIWVLINHVLTLSSAAWAAPQGGSVAAGAASIDATGGLTTITQATDRAIVNWQGFSTAAGEAVRFVQPGAASITLNRVTGAGASQLDGALSANGRVFVLNPNGIVFGATSQVNAAGLVASSLSMGDADFMAGRYRLTLGEGRAGAVVNRGTIQASGHVALVAPAVANEGSISGGTVSLAAGSRATVNLECGLVELDVDAGSLRRDVHAPQGGADALATAVNNRDLVVAGTASLVDGEVVLGAAEGVAVNTGTLSGARVSIDSTQLSLVAGHGEVKAADARVLGQDRVALIDQARVDASGATGGRALVGGGRAGSGVVAAKLTLVTRGAAIHADALGTGDGGEVVVRGAEAARVRGTLSARGGDAGGDGGFIETSAPRLCANGTVDIGAAHGKGGEWLIDPQNITIVSGCALTNATQGGGGGCVTFDTSGCCATIGTTNIRNALAGASCATVTVTTGCAGGGQGTITITGALDFDGIGTGDTLILNAHNSITVNAPILDGSPGGDNLSLVLNADTDANLTGGITVNNPINTGGAPVVMVAGQDITVGALISASAVTFTGANILDAGTGTVVAAGQVSFNGLPGRVTQSACAALPFRTATSQVTFIKSDVVNICNAGCGTLAVEGSAGVVLVTQSSGPGGGIVVSACGLSATCGLTLAAPSLCQTITTGPLTASSIQLVTGGGGSIVQGAGRVAGAAVTLTADVIGCGAAVLTDAANLTVNASRAGVGPVVQVNDLQQPVTLSVGANLVACNTFAIRQDCGPLVDLFVLCGSSLSGNMTGSLTANLSQPGQAFTLSGLTANAVNLTAAGTLTVGAGGLTATGTRLAINSLSGGITLAGNVDATTPGANIMVSAGAAGISGSGVISQCGGNVVLSARCAIGSSGPGAVALAGANNSLVAMSGVGGAGGVFLTTGVDLTVNQVCAQAGAGDVEITVLCGSLLAPAAAGPFIRGDRVALSATGSIGCGNAMQMQANTLVASLNGNAQFTNVGALCLESVVNTAPGGTTTFSTTGTLSLKSVQGSAVSFSAPSIVDADADVDVIASTASFTAAGGIGAADALELAVPVVTVNGGCGASAIGLVSTDPAGFASVTIGQTTGAVQVTATAGAASQIGVASISGGQVFLTASGQVVDADLGPDDNDITASTLSASASAFGASAIETTVGAANIAASGGNIAFANTGCLTLSATGGSLTASTSGALALDVVNVTGNIALTAGGAISDNNGACGNLTGATVTLTGAGVASLANPLETDVDDLTVNAGSGDIGVFDGGSLTFEGHTTGNLALAAAAAIALRTTTAGTASVQTDNADITGTISAAQLCLNALPFNTALPATSTINVSIGGATTASAQGGALVRLAASGPATFGFAAGGSVCLSACADVTVGSVNGTSSAQVAANGSIFDGGGTIAAPQVGLFANGSIGTSSDAIETQAGCFSGHAVTGSLFVADLDAMDVGTATAAGAIELKANGDLGVGAITSCATVRLESVTGSVRALPACQPIDAASATIVAAGVAGTTCAPIDLALDGRLTVSARSQVGGVSGAFTGTTGVPTVLALGATPGVILLNGANVTQRVGSLIRLAQLDPVLAHQLFGANGLLAVQAIQNQDKVLARSLFRTVPLALTSVATAAGIATLPLGLHPLPAPTLPADTSDPALVDIEESF